MKSENFLHLEQRLGRSSHEERGLKSPHHIEYTVADARRSSHEERGLKCDDDRIRRLARRRSSHEERGLKSMLDDVADDDC